MPLPLSMSAKRKRKNNKVGGKTRSQCICQIGKKETAFLFFSGPKKAKKKRPRLLALSIPIPLSPSFFTHSFPKAFLSLKNTPSFIHNRKLPLPNNSTSTSTLTVPIHTKLPHNVILKTRRRRKGHPPLPRTLPVHFFNQIKPICSIRPRNRRNQLGLPLPWRDGPRSLW